ncbi:MAG: cbb3-type cytochrome c oxidase N-terminal domain-containing protein [Candidatus Kapabacteria bacterium]|jgi:cytochrome c oxidase cbb3-type subunit 3|nr:cbb3-type cytochrome c oxidase N-terminal domain-containing protein [Candidatus Kapabacteria bacterium]
MSKVEDKVLEHEYDGILEYDNPLPRWWMGLFIFTIIWSVVYMFYYHIAGMGETQEQEYAAEFKMSSEEYEKIAVQMNQMWSNISYQPLTEADALASGEQIFKTNCVSCHGAVGEGGIGPNLTDEFFIHGGGMKNVMDVIINGVPEKGMISWKPLLKPEEIQKVASYVMTLTGSNPPNAKAPQGEKWEE